MVDSDCPIEKASDEAAQRERHLFFMQRALDQVTPFRATWLIEYDGR